MAPRQPAERGANFDVEHEQLVKSDEKSNGVKAVQIPEGQVMLKRKLSLFNGCAIIIGVIIGSGIFISPVGVLKHTGSPFLSVCVWAGCGLYATIGALCYAELGVTIPLSGGDYIYILKAFGSFPAFLYLWVALLIINPTSNAVIALTFAKYVLKPIFETCELPDLPVQLLAGCTIAFLTYINCQNVRWSTRIQNLSTVTKVAALCVIVGVGIFYVLTTDTHNFDWETLTSDSRYDAVAIALAFYNGVFSFSGWTYLNFVTEEIREPNKNLPRAIYISVPAVTVIYILANLAYFAALTPDEMLDSDAVAVSFGLKAMGPFVTLIPFFVACSCVGSLNGIIFASSRMFFAGARDGLLPELLAMININCFTPIPSLLFLGITSIAMLAITDVYVLINYLAFTETVVVVTAVAGMVRLRFSQPDLERPIKFNLIIPIIFILVSLFIILFPIMKDPSSVIELLFAIGIIATGIPFYAAFIKCQLPECLYNMWVASCRFVQKLLLCVTDEGYTKE